MNNKGIPGDIPRRKQILQLFHTYQRNKSDQQYISRQSVKKIAETLEMSPSEVDGVLSFYKMYSQFPRGKNIIRLCDSLSCRINRSLEIYEHLYEVLKIRKDETSRDGLFSLEIVNCLGSCDTAPNMMVNETLYKNLTVSRVDEILESYRLEDAL